VDAEALLVTSVRLTRSAHSEQPCSDCHEGFDRWPHDVPTATATCAECHEETRASWEEGVHAWGDEDDAAAASCVDCHGKHPDGAAAEAEADLERTQMNARCASCHETAALAPEDPHTDSLSCASCHQAHGTHEVDSPASLVAPAQQVATCEACHEEPAASYQEGAHGAALEAAPDVGLPRLSVLANHAPPVCTTCHEGHRAAGADPEDGGLDQAEVCGRCHEHYLESFDLSYHGQASALGSVLVATCTDCHSPHAVHAADDPRSAVHPDRLIETCGECHERASAGFVLFQPHADHNDRERYPGVYWTYHLMAALLVGVFGFFGLHTFLWLVRLARSGPSPGELTEHASGGPS